MKLLIADDNAAVRRLIRNLALPLVREIWECSDGQKAVSAYSSCKPDLVFMDIRMDPIDGIEATRLIKAIDPAARIVIVTDYDDKALRQAAIQAGAVAYALKDNLLDLIRLLEEMIQSELGQPGTQKEN